MEVEIHVWLIKLVLKDIDNDDVDAEYLHRIIRHEGETKKVTVDVLRLRSLTVEKLAEACSDHYTKNVPDKEDRKTHNKYYPFINLSRKLRSALDIDQSEGDIKVKTLNMIPVAMKAFFKDDPYKVIFHKGSDGWMLPYVIKDIEFHKGSKDRRPYTTITATAVSRNSETTVSYKWESARKHCSELLKEAKFVLPTEDLIKGYESRVAKYNELKSQTGRQVYLSGLSTHHVHLTVDGSPTKAVIDDLYSESANTDTEKETETIFLDFWRGQDVLPLDILSGVLQKEAESEDDEDEIQDIDYTGFTVYPIHPHIKCFDLNKHRFVEVHVANIENYPWNHNLAEKLVLDEETKTLINILVDSTKEKTEDIISGKASGTIVLATGLPGVGKTLTAEVFSEKIEKSLYVVQCSQLGIEVNSIEEKLQATLKRAERWGSILLIDEADVYIRDRGNDIVHNAIVGVFLRLIEYYNGILFLTSNRGDIIDDAIISRATAWIRYSIPDDKLLRQIWQVLSAQFKVDLNDVDILNLVSELPNISGRTVKNLLKLVKALEAGDTRNETSVEKIIRASKFQKLDQANPKA